MSIYTKTGDGGETSIGGGKRTQKDDPVVILLGELDELSACIGLARSHLETPEVELFSELATIQQALFDLGALVAGFHDPVPDRFKKETEWLEQRIDTWSQSLPPLKNFIFAGGLPAAATLHLSRAICRRMERGMVGWYREESEKRQLPVALIAWANRLSDYLFVAARKVNLDAMVSEDLWSGRH